MSHVYHFQYELWPPLSRNIPVGFLPFCRQGIGPLLMQLRMYFKRWWSQSRLSVKVSSAFPKERRCGHIDARLFKSW